MKIEDAIDYCENHECDECVIHNQKLDKRTKGQWYNGVPCAENLLSVENPPLCAECICRTCGHNIRGEGSECHGCNDCHGEILTQENCIHPLGYTSDEN